MNRLYLLLILMFAFTACKKDESTKPQPVAPVQNIPYLSRVMYFDTLYKTELQKDSIMLDSDGGFAYVGVYDQYYDLQEFLYDSKGRLVEANGELYNDDRIKYRFEYDANGNIGKRIQVAVGNNSTAETVTYTYDAYNRLAGEDRIAYWYNNQHTIRSYTYPGPGTSNPSVIKETDGKTGTTHEYHYTYDNKPNPYTTLPKLLYYLGVGEPWQNNVLSISVLSENNTITNVYRYDADNLPFDKEDNVGGRSRFFYQYR